MQGLNQRREELKCHKMPVQEALSLQPLKRSPAERSLLEYTPHPRGQSEINTRENPSSSITLIKLPRFVYQETCFKYCAHMCLKDPDSGSSSGSQSLEFGKGLHSREGISDAAAGQTALHSSNIPGVFFHELGIHVLPMTMGFGDFSGASHGFSFRNPSGFTLASITQLD